MQMRVADFLVKPVPPVELVRTCARVAKPASTQPVGAETTEGADFHLSARRRRRRRHHACGADRDAAAQQRRARQKRDLPGRSRLSARRLRRLSRHRAAAQSQRDRAAAGAARPAIARSHDLAASVRPRGGRGAEPAGGNAAVRSRRGDAAARSGVVAFRLCRVRHAAHLVLLDRQRAASAPTGCSSSARRRCRGCATPSSWSTPSASGSATGRSRRSSSIASCRSCFRPGLRSGDIEAAIGDAFLACIPNDYGLVREAIDRGVPLEEVKKGNKITLQLKKLIVPQGAAKAGQGRRRRRQEIQAVMGAIVGGRSECDCPRSRASGIRS